MFITIVSVIVAGLLFLANTPVLIKEILTIINMPIFINKYGITVIAIVLQVATISYPAYKKNKKLEMKNIQVSALLSSTRNVVDVILSNIFNIKSVRINIRVFIPRSSKYRCIDKIKKMIYSIFRFKIFHPHDRYIILKDIPGLSDPINSGTLIFEEGQGLVWQSYANKKIVYDQSLKNNNVNYSLNEPQLAITNELTFSFCVPIFSDTNNDVVGIIAYDSIQDNLTVEAGSNKERELRDFLTANSLILRRAMTDIFSI